MIDLKIKESEDTASSTSIYSATQKLNDRTVNAIKYTIFNDLRSAK